MIANLHRCLISPAHKRGFLFGMIRISITAAAFEAIAATLPSSVGYERIRAPTATITSGLSLASSTGFGQCAAPARATAT